MYNDLAFAPFGEQYAAAGTTGVGNVSFGGNNQDTTTNLYDAQFREYGIQGRWPSPDPAGTAAVNPANPQSWNRYAYALNNPFLFVDQLDLDECFDGNGNPVYDGHGNPTNENLRLEHNDTWVDSDQTVTVDGGGGDDIPVILFPPRGSLIPRGNGHGDGGGNSGVPTDKHGVLRDQKILGRFNSQFGTNAPLSQATDLGPKGLGNVTDNINIFFPVGTLAPGQVQPGRFGGGCLGTGSTLHVVSFSVCPNPSVPGMLFDVTRVHLDQGNPTAFPFLPGAISHLDYALTHSAGPCP